MQAIRCRHPLNVHTRSQESAEHLPTINASCKSQVIPFLEHRTTPLLQPQDSTTFRALTAAFKIDVYHSRQLVVYIPTAMTPYSAATLQYCTFSIVRMRPTLLSLSQRLQSLLQGKQPLKNLLSHTKKVPVARMAIQQAHSPWAFSSPCGQPPSGGAPPLP